MEKTNLTPKQKKVFQILKECAKNNLESPTIDEIKDMLGLNHKRSVVQFLNSLEKKGYITRLAHVPRSIKILKRIEDLPSMLTIPVIGSAGCDNVSIFAEESYDDSIIVEKSLVESEVKKETEPGEIIAIKAMGDSMQSAGIADGDHVIVQITENVKSGDRVVAIIEDMAVIKRIKFNADHVVLNPDSPDDQYKPIVLKNRPNIVGKVLIVVKTQSDDVEYFYEEN